MGPGLGLVPQRPRLLRAVVGTALLASAIAVGASVLEHVGALTTTNAARVVLGLPLAAWMPALAAIGARALVGALPP